MFIAIFLVVCLMVIIVDLALIVVAGIASWWQGMRR